MKKEKKYGFDYVKQTGIAHEWLSFYEGFDPEYYYGYFAGATKRFSQGLVLFISRNIYDNKFYVIGFYGDGEYKKDGFKVADRIPKEFKDEKYTAVLRAKKKHSAVFLEEAYISITAEELGIKRFGQNKVLYIGDNENVKPETIRDILQKAKQAHEDLLNRDSISDDKKREAKSIIEKILWVLTTYFNADYGSATLNTYFKSVGYYFPEHVVAQFYTALKTKGFVILSGLTGTGKTKIVQKLAELLKNSKEVFLFLPVRPDWRDSKPLLGYYNPLTNQYHKTKLIDFIIAAIDDYEQNRENATPYIVLLDEMNLAHVEYYFADFLSVLESGRDENGYTKESIKLHDSDNTDVPKELRLPPNIYIIGTVNMDETTHSLSPKVLDRAFTIEFHDVDIENYPPICLELSSDEIERLKMRVLKDLSREGKFLNTFKNEDIRDALNMLKTVENGKYWEILRRLGDSLEPYDLHFGYRVIDEIALFFQNARESANKGIVEFADDDEIFDLAVLMKVLPKFHGNRKRLERPLLLVLLFAKDGNTYNIDANKDADELFREVFGDTQGFNKAEIVAREIQRAPNKYKFRHTAKKALRMLRQLYEIGFASFN